MSDNYEKYEIECEKIRKGNAKLLDEFKSWLKKVKLADKTIRKHIFNVDFYINDFLLCEAPEKAQDGASRISYFLGFWFIKKTVWASDAQIKSNATSLKKFYTFMFEKGLISKEDLNELKETIKDEMPEWLATMRRYNDPSIDDMAEVWFGFKLD